MATPAVTETLISATEHDRPVLSQAEHLLNEASAQKAPAPLKLIGRGGEEVELPEPLPRLLRQALPPLLRGDSVAVTHVHGELTSQEAADLLSVPHAYLVRVLDEGQIPSSGESPAQRTVRLADLVAYKAQRDAERREGLAYLTQLSQEL